MLCIGFVFYRLNIFLHNI